MDPIVQQNARAYSRIAQEWNRRCGDVYDADFHARCRGDFLRKFSGLRVLDVGCGLGRESISFRAEGLQVVAMDIAFPLLSALRQKSSDIWLLAADMTELPLRAGCVDGIYAFASFLHIPPHLVPQTLANFARLIVSGGLLYLHHVRSTKGHTSYVVEDLLVQDNPAQCFCCEPTVLTELVRPLGFDIVDLAFHKSDRPRSKTAEIYGLSPYQLLARKQ